MPAAPSSPIDPAIGHPLAAVQFVGSDRATVLSVLSAVAIVRRRRPLNGKEKWSTDTVYAITSLSPTRHTWPK
jgi:hypothetical protein